jgi:hypothetical protein
MNDHRQEEVAAAEQDYAIDQYKKELHEVQLASIDIDVAVQDLVQFIESNQEPLLLPDSPWILGGPGDGGCCLIT